MDSMFSFWAFGVIVPLIISVMIFTSRSRYGENSIIILAAILTIKPVIFGAIGYAAWVLIFAMPVAGFLTSLIITICYWSMLSGHRGRTEAKLLVIMDWARLMFSAWLTYNFNTMGMPDYLIHVAFFLPTIFAIVALLIARNERKLNAALQY